MERASFSRGVRPSRSFRCESEPPPFFVELIDLEAAFGGLEGSDGIARLKPRPGDSRQEADPPATELSNVGGAAHE